MIATLAANITNLLVRQWDPLAPPNEFQVTEINLSENNINTLYTRILHNLLAFGWDNRSTYSTVQHLCDILDNREITLSDAVYLTYLYSGHMFA